MEKTGEFKKMYCTVLFLCILTLVVLAIRTNSITFNDFFTQKESATSVEQENKKKKSSKKLCVDGQRYDSLNAPIYKGDAYGDDKDGARDLRKYLKPYLKKKGYEQYTDILVAICAQESRFGLLSYSNWMQVKGYTGPDGIASSKAGTDHFIKVLKHAKEVKCTDLTAIIQAYNFGNYYLDYCMKHGGKDTSSIRADFQALQRKKTGRTSYGDLGYAEKILLRIK